VQYRFVWDRNPNLRGLYYYDDISRCPAAPTERFLGISWFTLGHPNRETAYDMPLGDDASPPAGGEPFMGGACTDCATGYNNMIHFDFYLFDDIGLVLDTYLGQMTARGLGYTDLDATCAAAEGLCDSGTGLAEPSAPPTTWCG
jgi:hypothetical protein